MTAPTTDPVGFLREPVQSAIDAFLGRQREILGEVSTEVLPLIDAAAGLLSGGKRLRPAFCYWGCRAAAGATGDDALIAAASSLEMFQAAALVHDDLIDASDTRRGRPSVHRHFETRHAQAGWDGAADRFGAAAAILVGDLLLGWSDEMLTRSGLDDEELRRARPVFERMRTEVGAGQYLDVLAQVDAEKAPDVQIIRAQQVMRYKSARYSVQHPLALGGRVAGADPTVEAGYARYGTALGEAFQLRDDVLGVYGDPELTGKPAGDDLREGKRTLLIAYALERADDVQRDVISTHLGDPTLDAGGVDRLREILDVTEAHRRVEEKIDDLVATATRAVGATDLKDDGRAALSALITLATTRTH